MVDGGWTDKDSGCLSIYHQPGTIDSRERPMKQIWIRLLVPLCIGASLSGPAFSAGDADSAASRQPAASAATNEAEDQYLFANDLFNKKMYELAAQQYEKFVTSFPEHPKAFQARLPT